MAILGTSGKVTLMDLAQAMDPDGKIATVAELLTQTNEILYDMPWFEANGVTGHQASIRTGLPTVIWRSFYQGVPPSKSQRAKITDTMAQLETRSEVDVDEAKLNGNMSDFRASEAKAFVESMNQTMADAVFYGNSTLNPERFNGLAPRYSTIAGASNGVNVLDAGGTGSDNASIWLIVWGKETVHGIYPKGSKAGLDHQDLGEIDAFDANNLRFRAYADLWKWKCGLHVKDWRYVVRGANIDVSNLLTSTGNVDLVDLMINMLGSIPLQGMGTPVFYAPRTVKKMLSVQAYKKSSNVLDITKGIRQFGNVAVGTTELNFLGVPIRTVDRLLTTEARVV